MEQESKPKNIRRSLLIILVLIIVLLAGALLGGSFYLKQKSDNQINTISENSGTIYFTDGNSAYTDNETGYTYYNLFNVTVIDRDNIESKNISLVYNGDKPVYNEFYMDEEPMIWRFESTAFGDIEMVSCQEDNTAKFTIETDTDGNVISLIGSDLPTYTVADERFDDVLSRYTMYKDRYDNMDSFMTNFLQSAYYGETTWNEVIGEVFVPEPDIIVEPYDFKDENDEKLEGYKITISGYYYPNAVYLKDVTYEGSMELFVNPQDMRAYVFPDSEKVADAFDVYVSLGTQWYMYGF